MQCASIQKAEAHEHPQYVQINGTRSWSPVERSTTLRTPAESFHSSKQSHNQTITYQHAHSYSEALAKPLQQLFQLPQQLHLLTPLCTVTRISNTSKQHWDFLKSILCHIKPGSPPPSSAAAWGSRNHTHGVACRHSKRPATAHAAVRPPAWGGLHL